MSDAPDAHHQAPLRQPAPAAVETSFERLLGRQPTESERAHLHRLRDALGLRDNDAFWSIVMALEQYDALFRAYPARLAEATQDAIANVRGACEAAAHEQAAAVQRALAERVAETSVVLARKLAERPLRIDRITAALAVAVVFGSLCVHAGYELAAPGRPFWVRAGIDGSAAARLLASVLSVPAGWMSFALLLPAALRGISVGWRLGTDPLGERQDRLAGWLLVGCCIVALGACVLVLARVA